MVMFPIDSILDAIKLAIKELESFDVTSRNILYLKENYRWLLDAKILYQGSHVIDLSHQERVSPSTLWTSQSYIGV